MGNELKDVLEAELLVVVVKSELVLVGKLGARQDLPVEGNVALAILDPRLHVLPLPVLVLVLDVPHDALRGELPPGERILSGRCQGANLEDQRSNRERGKKRLDLLESCSLAISADLPREEEEGAILRVAEAEVEGCELKVALNTRASNEEMRRRRRGKGVVKEGGSETTDRSVETFVTGAMATLRRPLIGWIM